MVRASAATPRAARSSKSPKSTNISTVPLGLPRPERPSDRALAAGVGLSLEQRFAMQALERRRILASARQFVDSLPELRVLELSGELLEWSQQPPDEGWIVARTGLAGLPGSNEIAAQAVNPP